MSQKDKILLRQKQLKKKLDEENRKKIEESMKKQTETKIFNGPIRRRYGGEGAMKRKQDALKKVKVIETIPEKMKTYPRIPFERAIKLRPRASPIEAERYFTLIFEQDLDDWLKRPVSAPSQDQLDGVLTDASLKKIDCVTTSAKCQGMNRKVYSGDFDQCGKLAPFYIWKRYIDETEFDEDVKLFMDQYKIDPFVTPIGSEESINRFFQAKYGLFTCQGSEFGSLTIDPLLIQKWEVTDKQLRKTWNLAILTAIKEGELKIETLGQYRNHFKESKKFQKYLKSHQNHEQKLLEQRQFEKNKTNEKYIRELEKEDFRRFENKLKL